MLDKAAEAMRQVMRALNWVVSTLTGEFLLEWYPNGGTVVLLPTPLRGGLFYALTVAG